MGCSSSAVQEEDRYRRTTGPSTVSVSGSRPAGISKNTTAPARLDGLLGSGAGDSVLDVTPDEFHSLPDQRQHAEDQEQCNQPQYVHQEHER